MRQAKLPGVLLVSLLAGCASQRVDWDYDNSATTEAQVSGWKTYAWMPVDEEKIQPYPLDGLMNRRVQTAVNQQLQGKGYQQVSEQQADFLVNYLTSVKTRREENRISTSIGYGMGSWGPGMRTETRVRDYDEGVLFIDFIEPAEKELVWRGRSRSRISDHFTPEKRTEQINKAVEAILEGFPSRPVN